MFQNINLGVKISIKQLDFVPFIYSNRDIIDYIEIILLPDFTIEELDIIRNLVMPFSFHLPNSNIGIDFGNKKFKKKNITFIQKITEFEDILNELNPICYIFHPESGDYNLSINNLKQIKIGPLAIENMPLKSIHSGECLAYDIEGLIRFFNDIPNLEFCFDINHAIKTAISLKINYIELIKEFLNFKKPIIFHIADGNFNNEFDEHLAITRGNYDMKKIKEILLNYHSTVNLTFETPRNNDTIIEEDLKNMKVFLKC